MTMTVRLTKNDREILEKLVEDGIYLSASDAIRAGIRALGEKSGKAQKAEA